MPDLLPPPLSEAPQTFEQWIVKAIQQIYLVLGNILAGQRILMTQSDDLSTAVTGIASSIAGLETQLNSLATEIQGEISDLAAAIAANNSGAVQAAVAQLQASQQKLDALAGRVGGLTTNLRADNPSAPVESSLPPGQPR